MLDGNTAAERNHAREQGRLADAADRITKDDLQRAREDLVEAHMGNPEKLANVLDCFCSDGMNAANTLAFHLHQLLNGAPRDKGETYKTQPREDLLIEARSEAQQWLTGLVEKFVTDDMVQERAEEMEREAAEDAELWGTE